MYSYGVLVCEVAISQPPSPDDRKRQIGLVRNEELKRLIDRCVDDSPDNRPSMGEVIEMQSALERKLLKRD